MQASGNQAREVGHINPQHSPNLVGNFAERCKVQVARVSRPSRDQHTGTLTKRCLANLLRLNAHGLRINLVTNSVVVLTREVDAHAVSEVTSVSQGQTQQSIANICHCHKCCSICLGT